MEYNSEYAKAIGWNKNGEAFEYRHQGEDELRVRWLRHLKQSHEPQACWGSGGSAACNRAKFSEAFNLDEIVPDAFVAGVSADTGGAFGGYTIGAEDLFMRTESGIEVEAFLFNGPNIKGEGLSADVGAYGGAVWNLDCIECYSGPFWILSVDASALIGVEFSLFGAPGAIPLVNNQTRGIALPLGPNAGIGASMSLYYVNYHGPY